jgi:uncharacterized protein
MNTQAALQTLLGDLKTQLPQLGGALVATRDGVSLAQLIKATDSPEQIATMAATTLALGKRIASSLVGADMTETIVSSGKEQIHLYAAGEKGVLVLVAPQDLGNIQTHARNTAEAIAKVLA